MTMHSIEACSANISRSSRCPSPYFQGVSSGPLDTACHNLNLSANFSAYLSRSSLRRMSAYVLLLNSPLVSRVHKLTSPSCRICLPVDHANIRQVLLIRQDSVDELPVRSNSRPTCNKVDLEESKLINHTTSTLGTQWHPPCRNDTSHDHQ